MPVRAGHPSGHRMSSQPATDLSLERIATAARTIDPVFRDSPQFEDAELNAALGRRVELKVETVNPLRSFKGRGADFKMRSLAPGAHVVCASAGNFGQAIAYTGRSRGAGVTVFVPVGANPAKCARMEAFGATVRRAGADFDAAKEVARAFAAGDPAATFVEDGEDPAFCEGAGTIAIELLRTGPLDAIVVPVGDGALIAGIAVWLKAQRPQVRVIGVCPAGAAAMAESWKARRPVTVARSDTIADGLAVRVPVARAVARLVQLVDEMRVVDDAALRAAMRLAARTLGLVLEPSGAAGIAALAARPVEGERVVTVLTGSHIHPDHAPELFTAQD